MKLPIAECLVLVAVSTACSGDVPATEKKSTETQPLSCSSASLSALISTDSSTLRRAERTLPAEQSTEGGEAAVFYAGSAPRMIRAVFFGEMGRAQELYYLLDSLSFVRIRVEDRYAKPITVEQNPSISSTISDTVWVCAGRAQATADSVKSRDALTTVRQILRTP